MYIALQYLLVMMGQYSMFHVDIFDSFQINKLKKQFWKKSELESIAFRIMPLVLQLHHLKQVFEVSCLYLW